MLRTLALCLLLPQTAAPCDVALVLAIDISGSIDAGEYAQQTEGLALALRDPAVADVLLQGQVALTVIHWSGTGRQAVVIDWQRMLDAGKIQQFADRVLSTPRAFTASDTAVGEAISFATARFATVADCQRQVIDISGDGPENAGFTVSRARSDAQKAGIQINAIAIEDMGSSAPITAFYQKWAITKGGFVITARGLQDYPRAMREKLLREVSKPVG
jgi:Ca-activated chloride channel homolog